VKIGIVGAGISGLATAQAVRALDASTDVVVFEAGGKAGGKVLTEVTPEGYLCEWGVNAFLDKSPRTLELCREVGLSPLGADESAKRRYVFSEGQLHKLPEKPPEFLGSRLLSLPGRLRVIGEIFSGRARKADETLAEFGTRHLGREAFEKLIDPMASGVFAGDARTMSLKSCFPRIHEVESEHGSLIRGLIKLQKAARKAGAKDTPGPGPGGLLTSFEGGMSELTDALAADLGERVRYNSAVQSVGRAGRRYQIHLDSGSEEVDVLVLASPAYAQARMLRDLAPAISGLLEEIPYPPLAIVCLGYRREHLTEQVDGFGFLVPSREERGILGTVFDSNVFPNRAPQGKALLRTMVGGARVPQYAGLPDDRLVSRVLSDLKAITGLTAEPDFCSIYRHERAIPQYLVGHDERLRAIGDELARHPGLVLTGNAFRGVSLNDCVLNALKTAQRLVGEGPAQPEGRA
jgi:oxygen-dependent protoporphyrinogen oxidase